MRLSGTKANSTNQYRGLGDQLYDLGGARPTLDLNFANNESLVDSVTGKNLVTHTRASSATYVDGDGVIKNAVTNLLGYSEDSSQWTTSDSTLSNTTVEAPDGSLTAISFEEDLVTAAHYARRTGFSPAVANTQHTISIFAKAGVRDFITLWADITVFDNGSKQTFNVANGTLGDSLEVDNASITDVGNGWYRCSMTFTSGAAPSGNARSAVLTNDTSDTSNFKAGISGIACYIWGFQLEQSSTVGEYVKTTSTINSAPRFDHDPVTGESLGLLVEEARTNLVGQSDLSTGGVLGIISRTTTTELTPAGEAAATRFTCVSGGGAHRFIIGSNSANTVTVSVFVKKDTHRYVNIGYGGLSNSFSALFDIEPGLTSDRLLGQGVKGTNSTNISAGYQDFPNGWVRIWAVGTTSGTDGFSVQLARDATAFSINSWTANGSEAIYVWGGQLEDDASFPTSLIITNGSTATRAADVTEITGNDFGTFNLLQHSEHLHEPFVTPNGWGTSASLTRTPNAAIAPNGTKTATRLTQPGGASSNQFFQRVITLPAGTYTLSVYAKAVSGSVDFALNAWNSTDLAQTGPVITATTEWQRFTHTFTTTVADTFIYIFQGVAGTVAGDIDFWGAQLEESSTATPYVKSDVTFTSRASTATYYDANGVIQTAAVDEARNVAFLPDSNGNFVSAGELLLEEARTNLVPYSVATLFNGWSKVGSGLSVNLSLNELGVFTGVRSISYGATWHGVATDHTLTAGITYNVSVWYRIGDVNPSGKFRILHKLAGTTGVSQIARNGSDPMDISDHVISSNSNHGTISNVTVKNLSNGVYQVSYNFVPVSTGSYQLTISPNSTVVGESVIALGAQVEEGSYPTSYIPTSGATATRAADVSSSSANTFGNSFYKQGEGTVFADATGLGTNVPSGDFHSLAVFSDGTNTTRIELAYINAGSSYFNIRESGTSSVSFSPIVSATTRKVAGAFDSSSAAATANGNTPLNDESVTVPTVDKLDIGGSNSQSDKEFHGTISRLTYWPQRLSNTTLQTITN